MSADKSNNKRVHIIKRENRWVIKKQGALRASKIYETKTAAVTDAKKLKLSGHDIVIHKEDGSIARWEKSAS